MTYSPTVPGGRAVSYKLWPVFTYSNGYWEVYRRFQGDFFGLGGWGEGATWEDHSLEEYVMGDKKNNEKIYMKKFFQLKVSSSIKT